METNDTNPCSFEQELAGKAGELAAQRRMRELQLVELVLRRITEGVVSKEVDIIAVMSDKGQSNQKLREIVIREILRSADDLLWCPEYDERAKSDQRVSVFTGSH